MAASEVAGVTSVVRWGLFLSVTLFFITPYAYSQLAWTPIYLEHSQVDLWTWNITGCQCSFNSSRQDCACCVPSGGCSCGIESPHRCAQCGLAQHCANMCNITLNSKDLLFQSGKNFGQIKSPTLIGPSKCTYRFEPDIGQRVELQIYRMLAIGRHNGTMCEGGWLYLEGGGRVCGADERFGPPVVLFSDNPTPVLHMQINENTPRSQFYAYFSFAPKASLSVGLPVTGGKPVNNTECDWVYDERNCRKTCVLASPGYPGLYPPNSRCRYMITSSATTFINLNFTTVTMPAKKCTSDYIAVYSGSTTTSPLLNMFCESRTANVVHTGQNLLVEFRSGPEVPPFNYHGFVATLNFVEITTRAPTTITESISKIVDSATQPSVNMHNGRYNNRDVQRKNVLSASDCDLEVDGEKKRSGHHDTRGKQKSSKCRLMLKGRANDTVYVSLASYNLSASDSCIEVLEEPLQGSTKSLGTKCGPMLKLPQEFGRTAEQFASNGRNVTVVLERPSNSPANEEYMDVSFYFHDERIDGTQKPKSICNVEYYGLSSPMTGTVDRPDPRQPSYINGHVKCKQDFIPAANQSIVITVESNSTQLYDIRCSIKCGHSGCLCIKNKSLDDIDHLLIISETGHVVTCLCGDHREWLPLGIRSSTPISVEWIRSSQDGLSFKVNYRFANDNVCGDQTITKPEGEIHIGNPTNVTDKLNQYYHQKCSWILDLPSKSGLVIEVKTTQDLACTSWNLTIHQYNMSGHENRIGPRLYTFCPRDGYRKFTFFHDINSAIIKLFALGRTAPRYTMSWRSGTTSETFYNGTKLHNSETSLTPDHITGATNKNVASLMLIIYALSCSNYHLV